MPQQCRDGVVQGATKTTALDRRTELGIQPDAERRLGDDRKNPQLIPRRKGMTLYACTPHI